MSVRVLIVEDEKNLVRALRGYLEREGFEMHEAFDGHAALEALRRLDPEVVVLDWMLPELDGMEVLREMKRFSEAYYVRDGSELPRPLTAHRRPRFRSTR